jgi:CelD/BcsL family acetyltransferase involved in cellulose biosynthesis
MKKVCIYDSFDALPAGYAPLFEAAEQAGGVFLSLSWFQHLAASAFESGTKLRIYGLESDTETRMVHAALVMRFQPRGSGWTAPTTLNAAANYYTSLFGPVLARPAAAIDDDLHRLAQAISHDTPHWDMVDMHPLALDSPLFETSVRALRAAGMITQSYFCFGNWYLQVRGRSYQEYFASLPSRLRNTVQRKSRQLESAGRIGIHIVQDPDELDAALLAYQHVYQSSWKGPESFQEFIPGLIRMLADQRKLRLGIAYVDRQPAAAQLWIVSGKTASIYKLAYDEQFAELSIGSILTARMMQHALDVDKVDEVDYLTGDEAYKQDWMSHRRERWGIVAFKLASARGMLAAIQHIGGHAVRTRARQMMHSGKNIVRTLLGQ